MGRHSDCTALVSYSLGAAAVVYTLHTTHNTLHTTHHILHTTHYTLHTTHRANVKEHSQGKGDTLIEGSQGEGIVSGNRISINENSQEERSSVKENSRRKGSSVKKDIL